MNAGYANTSLEPTWTTQQAAEFLGLARKTLYNRTTGKSRDPYAPEPRKMGRINGFIPSEVAAYRRHLLGLHEEPEELE